MQQYASDAYLNFEIPQLVGASSVIGDDPFRADARSLNA